MKEAAVGCVLGEGERVEVEIGDCSTLGAELGRGDGVVDTVDGEGYEEMAGS